MSITHESARPDALLWYDRFVPESPRGDYYLGDPDLSVPEDLRREPGEPDPLRDMLPELEGAFTTFWETECARIEAWGGLVVGDRQNLTAQETARLASLPLGRSVIDKSDKQRAFSSEARFVGGVANTVLQAQREDELSRKVILYDLDDSIESIPEPPEDKEVAEHDAAADAQAMVIRPGLRVVTNYLQDQPGLDLRSGVLSSKRQQWLDEQFWPMAKQKCPGVFSDKDLMISSKDGKIARQLNDEPTALRNGTTLMNLYAAKFSPYYSILPQAMRLNVDPASELSAFASTASDQDLKPAIIARLKGRRRGAVACVIWVDDWPAAQLVDNRHSDFRAVPLSAIGAQFELADRLAGLRLNQSA
jgi:hypothetical protein